MKADILEKMLPSGTWGVTQICQFPHQYSGKEAVQGQVEWGMDVRAALTQSLSSPGHPRCQQTSHVIYNRTPD